MKNYNYISIIMFVLTIFIIPADALCYEFPYAYSVKINDPNDNAEIIANYLISEATDAKTAQEDKERIEMIKENIVTSLYAEALATRIKIAKRAEEKKLSAAKDKISGAITGKLNDARAVLQDEVLLHTGNIAERLNDIMSMEAGIADLEGTIILTNLPKSANTSLFGSKDDEKKED